MQKSRLRSRTECFPVPREGRYRYSGPVMGHDLSGGRTMPYYWLDLTVTSAVKHEKGSQSYYTGISIDHSMSTGLWYGRETMQKWCLPGAGGDLVTDTGVLLKMDGALAMKMPMHNSLSNSWYVTRVVKKDSTTGAYLFEQKRVLDCTEMLRTRKKSLIL
jgi:hypothetical protein